MPELPRQLAIRQGPEAMGGAAEVSRVRRLVRVVPWRSVGVERAAREARVAKARAGRKAEKRLYRDSQSARAREAMPGVPRRRSRAAEGRDARNVCRRASAAAGRGA